MKRFKLIFFMSLMLILILGTTSYAKTPSVNELKNFFDFVIKKEQDGELNYTYTLSNSQTIAEEFYSYTQNINYSLDNLVFVSADSAYKSGIVKVKGLVFISNNTFGDNSLPFLYIKRDSNTGYSYFYKNSSNNAFTPCFWINNNGTFAFDNSFSGSTIDNYGYTDRLTISSDKSYIVNNFILTTVKTASFYYYHNNQYLPVLNNYNGFDYYDMYPKEPDIPDKPSGDTGGTTSPSGEGGGGNTGTIDLSNIESGIDNINNSINNQGQNIITNQNQNTDKIIANQNQNNQEVTQRLDDINSYDKDTIDNVVQGYLSGDYNASSSILALNDAFFHSSDDGDLVIDWDGVSYLGVDLIPQGSFNFTEFVSSDVQITKIYNYYKMFATASFGIILIAAYYNLALSVLGLGSYFAMNTDTEEESTSDLGNSSPQLESTSEYYTRKFKHESNMRYNKRG